MSYTVYGIDRSYFSRKLEAAMNWYGLPFEFVAKTMGEAPTIEREAGTRQMPVLLTPEGKYVADTTPTMMALDELVPARRMFPVGALGVLVHVVEEWSDEWLARIALHYRWNYPESAAFARADMAGQLAGEAPEQVRDMLANGIEGWGKKACRATGVSEPAQQELAEQEYLRTLQAADEQLGSTAFLLGERPCAVDAGILGGLRAHFLGDPSPAVVVREFKNVCAWVDRADGWDGSGELAPFPESTGFARFVLGELAGNYRSFALANAAAVTDSAKAFIADVAGDQVSYRTRPYPEQSRQMIVNRVAALDDEERARVVSWLDQAGIADCFAPAT